MQLEFKMGGEKKVNLEAPLAEAGPLFWNDSHFDNRMAANRLVASRFWSESAIASLKVSEVKKDIVRKCNGMFVYMSANVPYGKPVENPKLSAAVRSINDLLLMAQNLALSDTGDEDCVLIANDYFSRCHDIAWHTFDSDTNAINKSFTLPPNPMLGMKGGGGEENLSEEQKKVLLWFAEHGDEMTELLKKK